VVAGLTADPTSPRPRAGWAHPPVRIAIIYLAARAATTGLFVLAGALSPQGSRFGPGADLATYVLAWDAQWYWLIAVEGYPTQLPRTEDGDVAQNAWAFMPLFPMLARIVGTPLGSWGAGAFLVALAAGYLCCLVLRDVLKDRIGESAALWAVVFFAAAPIAPLLQIGYAESLFLLFVLLGIRALQRRRYGWLYAIVPLMGFTRPGVLAFALLIGLFGIWRLFARRREALRVAEIVHIVALGALATLIGFAWPAIAALATGEGDAYFETELAWRRLWVGDAGAFSPFEGWFQAADFWFTQWGAGPVVGIAVAIAIVIAIAALLLFEPHVRRLGVENRLWAASYVLYLLAVFFPQSSAFRLLFPLSPLWGALAVPRSLIWRVGVLVVALAGQWWWIWNMFGLGQMFWQIP
jgi:hypothetical protein